VLLPRIIPCLLVERGRLVKTVQFKDPVYIGDPLHVIRILQELGAGEIVLLDRSARTEGINFELLERVARECGVPCTYGGGVKTVEEALRILSLGIEKISFNTAAVDVQLIQKAVECAGSQSIVVSIDVRAGKVVINGGTQALERDVVTHVRNAEVHGAGEILLTSVDRDGCMNGYDNALIQRVASAVQIPVIACGGAGTVSHLHEALNAGAAAAAAGSMCVFEGRYRAVLPNFPSLTHV